MSIRTKNILTALLAVVLLGGFIFLAEGRKNDTDDRLDALDQVTTTTSAPTTTTQPPTTTTESTLLIPSTTVSAPSSPTTVRRTPTTRRASTATTRRPATTTPPSGSPAPPFDGAGTEASDNTGSFTRNPDGSYTGAGAPACSSGDSFCFYLSSSQVNGQLRLTATLRNNTNRTITFPNNPGDPNDDGLKIVVTVNGPTGTHTQFIMDASSVRTMASKEGLAISSTTTFPDDGPYTFTATCDLDYGS